jgi:hypothetical protein
MTGEARRRSEALVHRELPLNEAREYLETPIDGAERAGVLDLVRWFRQRYPTPAERLAYVRRAYGRWTRDPR